jgi:hypothetical protein
LVIFHSVADSIGNKKNQSLTEYRRSYRQRSAAKKNFPGESTGKIILFVFSTVITDGLSVGDCGMTVNISKLYQIPTDISVGNGNGNHRRNISVGNCGMGGNCLAPLGTILTAGLRLESRRYVFKIF